MIYKVSKIAIALLTMSSCVYVSAAVIPDRTRVILNESDKSASIVLFNQSKELPYLAQSWIENKEGKKDRNFLIPVPPIQRIEPQERVQIRITSQPAIQSLPKDRESVFYYNIREIPPKAEEKNVMQFALQSRLKVFWRPKAIELPEGDTLPFEKIKISRTSDGINVDNPTPYHFTIGYIGIDGKSLLPGSESVMVAPYNNQSGRVSNLPMKFKVGYVGDYGGLTIFNINCNTIQPLCSSSFDKRN